MNKIIAALILITCSTLLLGQEQPAQKIMNETDFEKEFEGIQSDTEEINVEVLSAKTSEVTPKMGLYFSDMDFEDAYQKHYPYCYGVYVAGVTQNGPSYKAGIVAGDIIMEFDGKITRFEKHLVTLIKSKNIGDEVKVKIFRDEEIVYANVKLDSLTPASSSFTITKDGKVTKAAKKLSVGHGGGGWIPVWYIDNDKLRDLNYLLAEYGFNELDESGMLMHGGGGHGNIGKGWFLGGMGAGYSIDKKKGYQTASGESVTRRMSYSNTFGGVTLDKRIAFSSNLISSLGFMLGWGGHNLQISQTDGNYNWDSMNDDMDSAENNAVELEKNYILFQPKAALMLRILDWLSIRAEGGLMLSHSYTKGWDAVSCEDNFQIDNSPETSYQGYTISIGPWFGF
ncbi:MAG: PDZ domain-containing protein [Candidatus Cloacimonetes bacterium]|nr:PDZ domain-containing protein [Candidatus Cloacimonadota bacterium]